MALEELPRECAGLGADVGAGQNTENNYMYKSEEVWEDGVLRYAGVYGY